MKGEHKGADCCYPTGNSHRAKHDDGSRHTRQRAGGMNTKHKSPVAHGGKK